MAVDPAPALVVLGAGGFVGRVLTGTARLRMPVKVVTRLESSQSVTDESGMTRFGADLALPGALDPILGPGDIVCNLAYQPAAGQESNLTLLDHIVDSSVRAGVARIVHCSTAVVVGSCPALRVDETTECRPLSEYERTKLLLEQRVATAVARGVDVGIVRPTAVIGTGGKNLLQLADSLRFGNPLVNYLRASLFGRRAMHLVPVEDVAAALLHVALLPGRLGGAIFNNSADDDSGNEFAGVEAILRESLGMSPRSIAPVPLPARVLATLLRLRGYSDWNPARIYDAGKLRGSGFRRSVSVADAVRAFGRQLVADTATED